MSSPKTLKGVSVLEFKKKWPRIYQKIMKTYEPVFDRFVAIDLWLQGKPAPTCEVCNVRLPVNKKNATRCSLHSKLTTYYTYQEFLDLVPEVNKLHQFENWNGVKSPANLIKVTCSKHGSYRVALKAILDGRQCQGCFHEALARPKILADEWIRRSIAAHNNFYQYDLNTFISLNDLVTIVCPLHGQFQQNADVHMRGHGCRACSSIRNSTKQLYSTEEFVTKANQVHDNKYSYKNSVYLNSHNRVTITCPTHGDFSQVAYYHTAGHGCPACGIERSSFQSSEEFEIVDFLKSHNINVQHGWFFKQRQFDILLPDHQIAIEHNGIFWHTSGSIETDKYHSTIHLERTELCEEHNIQLLHITDLEWHDAIKQNIWKSVILSKCRRSPHKVFARKCQIREVSANESREFFENNHLQGYATAKETLGLYFNDELVFAMSFGPARFRKENATEIIRAASKVYHNIVGGFTKLLKAYCQGKTGKIVSYANRRWSQGNVYAAAGFTLVNKTDPCYYYWDGKQSLLHRTSFMKHKLSKKLEKFDPALSEAENMYANKYRRFWDCGNYVFELNF